MHTLQKDLQMQISQFSYRSVNEQLNYWRFTTTQFKFPVECSCHNTCHLLERYSYFGCRFGREAMQGLSIYGVSQCWYGTSLRSQVRSKYRLRHKMQQFSVCRFEIFIEVAKKSWNREWCMPQVVFLWMLSVKSENNKFDEPSTNDRTHAILLETICWR